MDIIKRDIVTGRLKGGDKLPSVREIAERLKVNPNTAQRAYQELEKEGITYTQRGLGSFVTEDETMIRGIKAKMAREIIASFIKGMESIGYNKEEMLDALKKYLEEGV
uniref:GntR family transcriptional regulator n=1 Tax=Caldanaerobius polysaccharolyticus TaxID=44256 RepID=UPI000689EADF